MHLSQLPHILRLAPPLLAVRQAPSFSDYPACAQTCLTSLVSSTNCITTYGTAASDNLCLCNDIPYLSAVAKCVYNECGSSILDEIAQISVSNCASTGTPSALTVQEIIDEGLPTESSSKAASTSTADPTTTTAAAPQTSQTQGIIVSGNCDNVGSSSSGNSVDCHNSGGSSQSNKIALGIGIGFGIPTLFIMIWGLWYARIRYKKERKDKEVMRGETMHNDTNDRTGYPQYDGIELEAGVRPRPELESMV